ncbi:transporter substrate-binding domain-containing protein [Agrobacterium rhizogenes]|uniref:Cyclohexadienyl dehydratase n=1 Tax=Rhizobium rhizogenes NBRC 13257 TaxID=1220581 RepID=A0AA87Q4D7_RHIRH|nr:transporter substrate-binding domain-containing protein [Rhizobium rhizogenes]OCJ18818.1 amino acid ABC transporter [Agrobacterium sp. B131/95]NTF57375.1 transporter substrate-binding domain-containing protein [Rhizobium rhizogenes]NTF76957.1 transporter substrate-binding domain-containing protein [Rhizobium rhizogenes]NTF95674.1 transporter substrate-binding domain-containing protein [Rhizobium rhizogenes]NTG62703.1 transporter substrate-binding domain-containing protein [Rhizobium rhizoge
MKRAYFLATMFAALNLTANMAVAEDGALAEIQKAGVIKIGTTGDYKPFSYKGADGSLTGADIAMGKDLATSLNVKPEFVMTTWKTMLDDFKAGKFDVALGGITVNPARAEVGDFSVPNVSDGKRPIARCADKDKYATLEAIDQPSVRVIVNPGGTNDKFAHEHFSKAPIEEFADNKAIFDEIAADKADVMITDGIEVDIQSKLHPGVLCPVAVKEPFTHFDNAYLLRKDPALKAAVDAFMRKQLDSGDWKKKLDAAIQ